MRIASLLTSTVFLGALCSGRARAQTPAVFEVPASSAAAAVLAPVVPAAVVPPAAAPAPAPIDRHPFDLARDRFLASARGSYLDKTGRTPLPALEVPEAAAAAFPSDVAKLKTIAGQTAYVESGRGAESVADYADMVVLVAARLGVKPPESALSVYRDRVRLSTQPLTTELTSASAELAADVHQRAYKSRYLYLADVVAVPVASLRPAEKAAPAARRGKKTKRRRAPAVSPPPEPVGPAESVLDSVDWDRAEELASAAEVGAQGWYSAKTRKRARREQRRRKGRCYEWVRMALQETGLWTNDYRDEVPLRGDWRRSRRAFSFAWAMNTLETKEQKDPAAARKAPLRRLDLRVDPLVIGSVIVFDRNVCGFNNRSGHIEVVSSIAPLRASSYKFHELKLPCLIGAAIAGRVHVYVPRRMDPPASVPPAAPAPPTPG